MDEIKRIHHCSHWGAYSLLVKNGKIAGVEPFADDPDPSPIIQSVPAWAESHRRIARPMARKTWLAAQRESRVMTPAERATRGHDEFVAIEWDEALSLVADESLRVAKTHGNASIFAGSYGWTNSGRFHHASSLLRRTMNLIGGYTGHVDTYSVAAGPVILRHTLGSTDACQGRANTLHNVAQNTETLIVFGALTPRTAQNEAGGLAMHRLTQDLRSMADQGVRIIHISPQRDDVPDWLDTTWWPIKPNTDTALMLAMAYEILAANKHNEAFLARYCSGTDTFLSYLRGTNDGVAKTAEWAAGITGLPASDIRALATVLPDTRTMLSVSWSLQRAHHGEQPFWAALALASMIGQIGLPGGGVGYGYGSLGGVGAPVVLSRPPAMSSLANDLDSFIPVARVTDMLENPGASYEYEGKQRTYPDIRLVYWAGGNPYHHHQDLNRFEQAWSKPETIVVQDPMWTATALRADIVLPACTSIERNDLAGNRRSDRIVAMKKAIEPIGQSKSDFDIFSGLAEKFGELSRFNEGRDEMGWIRHLYEQAVLSAADRCNMEMPDFDTFWLEGVAEMPANKSFTYLEDFRTDPDANPLATESGRIVLGSQLLNERAYDDCRAHPAWIEPVEWLNEQAETAGRFHMLTPQPEGRLHSQLIHAGPSAGRIPDGREQIRINPDDALRLQLAEGDVAKVWNKRGACLATVRTSADIRQGVVTLPTGAWLTPAHTADGPELAGNANVLTLDVPSSAFGQGCAAQTCLVFVGAWHGETPDPSITFDALLPR